MRKGELYSWRMTAQTRAALEHEARRQRRPLAGLLDQIAEDWLRARRSLADSDEVEQARLQAAAARCLGRIAGSAPYSAASARGVIRDRVSRRRAG
jgi:hypothetical protein